MAYLAVRKYGERIKNTMQHLFEAEQKARTVLTKTSNDTKEYNYQCQNKREDTKVDSTLSPAYQELLFVSEQLESASLEDRQAVQFAGNVWKKEASKANRLGFYQLKTRIENAALGLLDPIIYQKLDKRLHKYKATWHNWSLEQRKAMRDNLEKQGISCSKILHRTKHTAGVLTKMKAKDLDMEEVYDLFAFRLIVPTEADCYVALGLIHKAYSPDVSRFKDYITHPKSNGYRSIHTCVKAKEGPVFEVQIRSIAMDIQAESGDAAHWLYNDKLKELTWLKRFTSKYLF